MNETEKLPNSELMMALNAQNIEEKKYHEKFNQLTRSVKVKFKKTNKDARIPLMGSAGAACFDLFTIEEGTIRPNTVVSFDTGIAIELPENYVGIISSRSGLAFKHGIHIANPCGIIDSDFRNSIKVGLVTHVDEMFYIKKGDRIAQLIILPYPKIEFEEVEKLSETKRDQKGIGSTGLSLQDLLAQD